MSEGAHLSSAIMLGCACLWSRPRRCSSPPVDPALLTEEYRFLTVCLWDALVLCCVYASALLMEATDVRCASRDGRSKGWMQWRRLLTNSHRSRSRCLVC